MKRGGEGKKTGIFRAGKSNEFGTTVRVDERVKNRILVYPAVTVFSAVSAASVVLFVTLWGFPSSIDTVANLFCIDLVRAYFPGEWRAASYLAQRYGGPWDVFFPSLLVVNIASGIFSTVFFSFWFLRYPLRYPEDLDDRKFPAFISASHRMIGQLGFGSTILITGSAFFLYLFLSGNPDRDLSKLRYPLVLKFPVEHIILMALPSMAILVALAIKMMICLWQLQRRCARAG